MITMTKPKQTYHEAKEEAERAYTLREIVPLKNQGKSLREIGKIVGISYEQVRYLLNKYG